MFIKTTKHIIIAEFLHNVRVHRISLSFEPNKFIADFLFTLILNNNFAEVVSLGPLAY